MKVSNKKETEINSYNHIEKSSYASKRIISTWNSLLMFLRPTTLIESDS